MTTALQVKILKKDADGRVYAIPEREVNSFIYAAEAVELAEFMSPEWHQASDEFAERFGAFLKEM